MTAPLRGARGLRLVAGEMDPADWRDGLALVTDYRGDATVELRDGGQVDGYVFDVADGDLRLLPADGSTARRVPLVDVAAIELSGRDTAEGKSFETWIRKWAAAHGRTTEHANPSDQ